MNSLLTKSIIINAPISVALLDKELRFVCCSQPWVEQFNIPDLNKIIGKTYIEVLPDTPKKLLDIIKKGLKGYEEGSTQGEKFITPIGRTEWLKYKTVPWRNDKDEIDGVTIHLETYTRQYRRDELYKKAEKIASIGGWELDLINNTLYWTGITRKIHEVPRDFVPDVATAINFYKEGENRDKIQMLVDRCIRTGEPWDAELQIVTATGKELWVSAKGEAEIVNGKCVALIGSFQDIDEKKKLELQHEKALKRLDIATKSARIGTWEYGVTTQDLFWDNNNFVVYGVKPENYEKPEDVWNSLIHPEDKDKCANIFAEALTQSTTTTYRDKFRIVWPNKEVRHIRSYATIERDRQGNAIRLVGINWDVTEQENAQEELYQFKESFQSMFDHSTIGMALVSKQGLFMSVNKSLCKSLGYTNEELLNLTFQEITHPEDLDLDLNLLHEIIDGKRNSYQIDKRYFHKNGSIVYIILTVTAVTHLDGSISHFISQIVDITVRIKAEQQLREFLAITEEQNESLLNFAHIVSHNLRSHTSNLSMLTIFLQKEQDPEERAQLFKMLEAASDSLSETIVHLNEVVQVKTGDVKGKMKKVNLHKATLSVKKNLEAVIKEKKAICEINVPEDLKVTVVPAYLDSILLNLLTNALKYASPERTPIVQISTAVKEEHVVIKVQDNGLGINLERHGKKIFGMYKTFHKHEDSKGIGLFITKNQIESMGGKIEVESTEGEGTTFSVLLKKQAQQHYLNKKIDE